MAIRRVSKRWSGGMVAPTATAACKTVIMRCVCRRLVCVASLRTFSFFSRGRDSHLEENETVIRKFIATTGTQDGRCPIRTSRTISPEQCEKILLWSAPRSRGGLLEGLTPGLARTLFRGE
eukprot:4952947-Prymnesium_polylepis.1